MANPIRVSHFAFMGTKIRIKKNVPLINVMNAYTYDFNKKSLVYGCRI